MNRKFPKRLKSAPITLESERSEEPVYSMEAMTSHDSNTASQPCQPSFITNIPSSHWQDLPTTPSTAINQYLTDGKDTNAIDLLFLSYAETFKKFPPKLQLELKLELATLFSETELKLLQSAQTSTDNSCYTIIKSESTYDFK